MANKYLLKGKIAGSEPMSGSWRALRVECPEIAGAAEPGQFAQLRAWNGFSPLLCRPISIAGVEEGGIVLFWIKRVGPGTEMLADLPVGAPLDVTGPLGRGFGRPGADEVVYFVAGSVGAAPLRFAANAFGCAARSIFFYGCGNECEAGVASDEVVSGSNLILTTDDGTAGEKGFVTEPLKRKIIEKKPDRILACGPTPMLKAVAALAGREGIYCEVSLESYMSCGIGACMGCAVPLADGSRGRYAHACADGPVFDSKAIRWEEI
jgi:dihydroorotate dehydrogenase electron transfer subunit